MAIRAMRKNSVARDYEIQHFERVVHSWGCLCVVVFWLLRLFCALWLRGVDVARRGFLCVYFNKYVAHDGGSVTENIERHTLSKKNLY
jgi:hypothetical protein